MAEQNAAVGIFNSLKEAESSIKKLQRSGFDMKRLSIVCRDFEADGHIVGYCNADEGIDVWDSLSGFWGGSWNLMFGAAYFAIPGIGPLIAFGPLVGSLQGVLDGRLMVGGISALAMAFIRIGIPEKSSLQYETAVKADRYLILTYGSPFSVSEARTILVASGATHNAIHPGVLWESGGRL